MNNHHLSYEQLYAYDDGVLFGAEQRAVERHLATCGECRAQLARSSAIVHGLKQRLGSTSAPASLRMAIREQIREHEPRRATAAWVPTRGLAFASLAVSGLLVAILIAFVYRLDGGQSLVGQLVEKHLQLVREPQSIQMPGDAGLSTWMDAQVHEHIDLSALKEFSLVGGRVDKIDGQLAAHVLYQQTSTTALSIFVWHGDFSTANLSPRQVNGDPYYVGAQSGETVVLWREKDVNYACVGGARPEAVLELAARVRSSDNN